MNENIKVLSGGLALILGLAGCTVKAVGDPKRPITINAHVTLDINGLKDTASSIEDYVSGEKKEVPNSGGHQ